MKSKSIISILFLPAISIFLLSGCGGDSETSPSLQWAPVSAPVIEKINGIAVPPEPDVTLNNASLMGVDSNDNGVRDDVERRIVISSVNKKSFDEALVVAKLIGKTVTGNYNSPQTLAKEIDCASYKYDAVDQQELFIISKNTPERNSQYVKWRYSIPMVKEVIQDDPNWNGDISCSWVQN